MTRAGNATLSPPAARVSDTKLQLPSSCDPPGPSNPPQSRVWVVFGGSGHMGRSVVKAALANGDIVTAVGKLHEDTIGSMAALVSQPSASPSSRKSQVRSPEDSDPPPAVRPQHRHPHPRYLPLVCDVRLPGSVAAVFNTTLARWGHYDIVANCSGYGVIGACEDQDDADIRGQLETNFFGTLHIIQASLPYFRTRGRRADGDEESSLDSTASPEDTFADGDTIRSESSRRGSRSDTSRGGRRRGGRYLIFSSTSGALGVPGLGPYCATKYAVEGLIESLLYEVDPFGIRATLVEPGHVRRDDSMDDQAPSPASSLSSSQPTHSSRQASSVVASSHLPTFGHFFIKPPSQPYAPQNSPAAHARRVVQWLGDNQPTSAVKAAELVWQLGHCRFPPLRLLLGSYAVESIRDRLRTIIEEIEDWKYLNFGPAVAGADARGHGDDRSPDEMDDDLDGSRRRESGPADAGADDLDDDVEPMEDSDGDNEDTDMLEADLEEGVEADELG